MQRTIPSGEKVLVRLDKNFLLDFKRNTIYVNELYGGASLYSGIPIFKGQEALADYLVRHDISYLAYSYGDEASFSRALFGDSLALKVNVCLRKGAQIAFDFQDDALALGQRRKKLFPDERMFLWIWVNLFSRTCKHCRLKNCRLLTVVGVSHYLLRLEA